MSRMSFTQAVTEPTDNVSVTSSFTPTELLPNWATEGFTPVVPFNITQSSTGEWGVDINWRSTLPTDLYNQDKWLPIYIDPVDGNNANSGLTQALPRKDLNNVLADISTASYLFALTNMTGTVGPVCTTATAHYRLVDEWVYMTGCTGNVLTAGWYKITAVTSTTFTLGGATASGGAFTAGNFVRNKRLFLKAGSTFYYGSSGTGIGWNNSVVYSDTIITPDDGLTGTGRVEFTHAIKPSTLTWTLNTGTCWQASTALTTHYMWDLTSLDSVGAPRKFTLGASIASVQATVGEWILSGGVLYVNTGRSTNPQLEVLTSRSAANSTHLDAPYNLWVDRVDFKYSDRAFYVATFAGTTYKPLLSFNNCTFQFASGTNGFTNEGHCVVYQFNCIAQWNESDGFNDKAVTAGTSIEAVRVNCIGRYNGALSTTLGDYRTSANYSTNQGITIHQNAKHVGVNCYTYGNGGNGVLDVALVASASAYSWYAGCYSFSQRGSDDTTTYPSTKFNCDFGVGSIASATAEKIYLVDCKVSSPYDGSPSTSTYPATLQVFASATMVTDRNIAPTASLCKLTGSAVYTNYKVF